MERGEIWWADVEGRCGIVLLTGDAAGEIRAIQVVAPARAEQKHGFRLLSGPETAARRTAATPPAAEPGIRAVGVEIPVDGLPEPGAVRIALPCPGIIPCNWLVTLSRPHLIERVGRLSPERLLHLDDALHLAGLE